MFHNIPRAPIRNNTLQKERQTAITTLERCPVLKRHTTVENPHLIGMLSNTPSRDDNGIDVLWYPSILRISFMTTWRVVR